MNKPTGQQIEAARKARGWTQPILAEQTGLELRTIQRAENGEAGITSLRKIATVLGLDVSSLIDSEDVSTKETPQPPPPLDPFLQVCAEMMRRLYLSWLEEPRRGPHASEVFKGMDPAPNFNTHLQFLIGEELVTILSFGPKLQLTPRGVLEAERRGFVSKEESAAHLEQRNRFLLLLTDQYEKGPYRSYAGIMRDIGLTKNQYYGCLDILDECGLLEGGANCPSLNHRGYEFGRGLRASLAPQQTTENK